MNEIRPILEKLRHQLENIDLMSLDYALLVSLVSLMVAWLAYKASRARGQAQGFGASPMRLDKIEVILNDIKSRHGQQIDQLQGEIKYLKNELESVRHSVAGAEAEASEMRAAGSAALVPVEEAAERSEVESPIASMPRAARAEIDPELGRSPTLTSIDSIAVRRELDAKPEIESEESKKKTETAAPVALSTGLTKTRQGFFSKIRGLFSGKPKLDSAMLEQVEELLVASDLGINFVSKLVTEVKSSLARGDELDEDGLKLILKTRILGILEAEHQVPSKPNQQGTPRVIMIVGVNGVGKTTTVGKLAKLWQSAGSKVMVAAADTFRAAAVEQLSRWAEAAGVTVIKGAENAKPASVVFDAMQQAKAAAAGILLIDTAGRLHNKSNLMAELEGVKNMVERHDPTAPHEVWLVVDGATGQNALTQAREFNQAIPLTGIIVTKLDGTPKGGIVVAIKDELNIPVRYIGVGEGAEDLRAFIASDFVDALFDTSGLSTFTEQNQLSQNAEIRRRKRRVEEMPQGA